MRTCFRTLILLLLLLSSIDSYCDTIYLNNGDRISGEIISKEGGQLTIRSEIIRDIDIHTDAVRKIEKEKNEPPEITPDEAEFVWKKEISLGYNASRGNTETEEIYSDFMLNRKHQDVNDIMLKGNMFYSEAEKKMDARRWYGMAKFSFNFGSRKKWYNYYSFEADHDRFANIDYRLLPAAGIGYWFFDLETLKLMAEIGAGWEHTNYRDSTKKGNKAVLIPRAYFEKRLFKNTLITENFYYYPSVIDFGDYRFRSETALTTELNSHLALRLSLIDDFNALPEEEGTEKNDIRLMSSLVYSY